MGSLSRAGSMCTGRAKPFGDGRGENERKVEKLAKRRRGLGGNPRDGAGGHGAGLG